MRIGLIIIFLLSVFKSPVCAQPVTGVVIDKNTGGPLENVNIDNVHTSFGMISDREGKFFITASKGQLLEFRKMGYKTVRVRIPDGNVPSYFKIIMQEGMIELPQYELQAGRHDWKSDSMRYHELYKHELDLPRMSALDMIQHPFSALSKKNQEIWAFQNDYNATERQKYIDHVFNPKTVSQLTGLTGDSLNYYMRRYRPDYEMVRNMNEYTLYNYIKNAADRYRGVGRYSPSRISN